MPWRRLPGIGVYADKEDEPFTAASSLNPLYGSRLAQTLDKSQSESEAMARTHKRANFLMNENPTQT